MARIFIKSIFWISYIFLMQTLYSSFVMASPCCGQNSSSLNVMTLRQDYNVSITQSQMTSLGRVYNATGDFFIWQDSKERSVSITQISLGLKLNERWQMFLGSAYQHSEYQSSGFQQSEKHMMDTSVGVTYELLPEYTFSYYKPIVYMTVFANLPTGHSVFDGQAGPENIKVSGHDQWGLGLGFTLQKILQPWSVMLQIKSLRLFSESFDQTSVEGFFDSSVQFMLGYSLPLWDLNLNFGITQLELSERQLSLSNSSNISVPNSRSTLLNFGLSKNISESMSMALSYSDQTLLGKPKNTLLAQGVNFILTYNAF